MCPQVLRHLLCWLPTHSLGKGVLGYALPGDLGGIESWMATFYLDWDRGSIHTQNNCREHWKTRREQVEWCYGRQTLEQLLG